MLMERKAKGKTGGKERRGRRHIQLLDGLNGNRRKRKLKKEAIDHTRLRSRFGRGYGRVVRETTESKYY